jgi:hypothetical protein
MFISQDLNNNINHLIDQYNKNKNNLEFEIRFQQNNNFNFFSNLLHSLNKYNFKIKTVEYNLDISINNTRLSINNNKDHIVDLCNNNFLNLYDSNFKDFYTLIEKKNIKNIDINDIYGFNTNDNLKIRISLSEEIPKSINNDIIIQFKNEQNKKIRFKTRFSFSNNDFRFDLTITNKYNISSNINNDISQYEIELEYINKNNELSNTVLFGYIKFIYKLMYLSNIPLNIQTKNNIFNNYIKLVKNQRFIGDEVRTFKLNHLDNTQPFNILNNDITNNDNTVYAVTDKADGSRYLMYISPPISNMKDNVFFLDKFNNIYRPGIYTNNESLYNTILDGEFIDYKNIFLIFDILFYNNTDIRELHLITQTTEKSRWSYLKNINLSDFQFIDTPIIFSLKKYFINNKMENNKPIIFKHIRKLWESRYEDNNEIWKYDINKDNEHDPLNYKLDGLIFTPVNRPYYNRKSKFVNRAYNLKWKPPSLNSIDFLVFFPDTENIFVDNIEYKVIHILSSNQGKHIDFTLNNNQLKIFNLETANIYNNAHIIYVPIKNNSIFSLHDEKQIRSGNIIELVYNNNSDKDYKFNWQIIRSRPDKKFANSIRTAIDVWNSIHENITENYIFNDIYNDTNITNPSFYTQQLESKPAPWKFHNQFKTYIINNLINHFNNKINVLELGSGRGGDFPKFHKTLKVKNIIAIEYFEDGGINIAKSRYVNNKINYSKSKNNDNTTYLHYIQADFTQNIYKNNKFNIDFLINKSTEYSNNLGLWFKKLYTFDFISSQFALQFAFKNKTTIKNFFNNISKSLSDNGIFFCTFPDGDSIFNEFKSKKSDSFTISSSINEKQYFSEFKITSSILKNFINKYDSFNDIPDNKKLGIELEVKTPSFHETAIREYFVNKDLLIKYAEKNGLIVAYNYKNFNLSKIKTNNGVGIWNSYPYYTNFDNNNKFNMKDDPNAQLFSNLFSFLIFTKKSAQSSSN